MTVEQGKTRAALSREKMDKLSERIIGCAYAVSNGLGAGFLEKVYENALAMNCARADCGWGSSAFCACSMTASLSASTPPTSSSRDAFWWS